MSSMGGLDDAGIPAEVAPVDAPAFEVKPAWNAAGCAGIAALTFFIFVAAQTAIFIWLFLHVYPETVRHAMSPAALRELQSPSAIARVLTATNLTLMSIISNGALILAAAGLARLAFGATLKSLGMGVRPTAAQMALGFVVGVGLLLVSTLVSGIETKFLGPHPQFIAEILTKRHGLGSFALDLLSVSIAAPIGEELFFRGLIFAGLVQRMQLAPAAILSGAIFGAAHIDVWNFPSLFLIGIGLAYLYHRNRTLWPNIAAHATVNGVTLALAYVAPQLVK